MSHRHHHSTPDDRCRRAVDNFRRARLTFINDLDADYDHNRGNMNRSEIRRCWKKLRERFAAEGRAIDFGVLGTDQRVHEALGVSQ